MGMKYQFQANSPSLEDSIVVHFSLSTNFQTKKKEKNANTFISFLDITRFRCNIKTERCNLVDALTKETEMATKKKAAKKTVKKAVKKAVKKTVKKVAKKKATKKKK